MDDIRPRSGKGPIVPGGEKASGNRPFETEDGHGRPEALPESEGLLRAPSRRLGASDGSAAQNLDEVHLARYGASRRRHGLSCGGDAKFRRLPAVGRAPIRPLPGR